MKARAGVLLEVMLALALLVSCSIVILRSLDRSAAGVVLARNQLYAAGLARSAIAKIETGIETPQNLHGPVPSWTEPTDTVDIAENGGGGFEDAPPIVSGWELDVQTEPSSYPGLTLVTVTASKQVPPVSFTLRQLVRLGTYNASVAGGDR